PAEAADGTAGLGTAVQSAHGTARERGNQGDTAVSVTNRRQQDAHLYVFDTGSMSWVAWAGAGSAGGGVDQADNSAFTAGTTHFNPTGGFYHSTLDSVTDGRAAATALTIKRAFHVNLRDSTGGAISDAAEDAALACNPLRQGVRASAAIPSAMST